MKTIVLCLNIIVLQSCCLCCFRNLIKVSATKKDNGLVGSDVAIGIRRFPVQTPLGSQVGVGFQPHYKTSGNLQVSEAVPSRMTESLPRDSQIVVKKTEFFSGHV